LSADDVSVVREHSPPPVARFEPERALEALNAQEGCSLVPDVRPPGGEVGGMYVAWPDGRTGVLKRAAGTMADARLTGRLLADLRNRGLQVPTYQLVALAGEDVVTVQERLPGSPPTIVTDTLLGSMLHQLDQFRDVMAMENDVRHPDLYLLHSGPGFCLHESLRHYSDATRALLHTFHQIGRHLPDTMPGSDLMHMDFHPGNVLVDDAERITGIIDWDVVLRGDARFGLVTLAFDLGYRRALAPASQRLTSTGLDALRRDLAGIAQPWRDAFMAHMGLRQLDWSIRHHSPEVVAHYVAVTEAYFATGELPIWECGGNRPLSAW